MEERQVTIGSTAHPAPRPFLLTGTQDLAEHEGTYRPPEAQLDRFLLRTSIYYPALRAETEAVRSVSEQLRTSNAAGARAKSWYRTRPRPTRPRLGDRACRVPRTATCGGRRRRRVARPRRCRSFDRARSLATRSAPCGDRAATLPPTQVSPSGNMMAMDGSPTADDVRLAATPGWGRIARRGRTLMFVPESPTCERGPAVDDLFRRYQRVGPSAAVDTDVPRCVVDWSNATGHVAIDSSFDLWIDGRDVDGSLRRLLTVEHWIAHRSERSLGPLAVVSNSNLDALGTSTDLRDGDVHAGAFGLVFQSEPLSISLVVPEPSGRRSEVTAEPPEFGELTDLDVTLLPVGPVTYPDDDTDRTVRRPGDIRCPRGHANVNTDLTCRVCGDSLDSTADRPGPRASTAVAGLRLPDGSVIPINRSIAIGRSPSAEGARLGGAPQLVAIDAPGTVSRTHVVVRVDDGRISVTDCGARGRTAVVPGDDLAPIALSPWKPQTLSIGDTVKLGGPTTLTITDPAELRVPPAFEPTATPPERDETT